MLDGSNAPETIPIKSTKIYPTYSMDSITGTTYNDILLVVLSEPSNASTASWNSNPNSPADNETVTVLGFGVTTDGGWSIVEYSS